MQAGRGRGRHRRLGNFVLGNWIAASFAQSQLAMNAAYLRDGGGGGEGGGRGRGRGEEATTTDYRYFCCFRGGGNFNWLRTQWSRVPWAMGTYMWEDGMRQRAMGEYSERISENIFHSATLEWNEKRCGAFQDRVRCGWAHRRVNYESPSFRPLSLLRSSSGAITAL